MRHASLFMLAIWLGLAGGTNVQGQIQDDQWRRLTNALESRRLFRLAIVCVDDQLAAYSQDPVETRDLWVRRIHLETAWAVEADRQEQQQHWDQLKTLEETSLGQFSDPQSASVIQLQYAMALLTRSRAIREEDEWKATRDEQQELLARENLREARQRLEAIESSVPRWMTDRNAKYPEEWKPQRWVALQRTARFHLARAAFERAYWYGEDERLNRIEALRDADEQLADVSSQIDADDPLWWEVQLARVQAARQRDEWQTAATLLKTAQLNEVPSAIRDFWLAEILRVENGLGEKQRANAIAAAILEGQLETGAPAYEAVLEILLDRFAETKEANYQQQAVNVATEIERRFGAYWGRKANRQVVDASAGGAMLGGNLEVMQRVADEAYLKGDIDEAIATYQKALDNSVEQQNFDAQLLLLTRIAAIQQERGDFVSAAKQFEMASATAAEELGESDKAAEYAWLAIANTQAAIRGGLQVEDEYRRRITSFLAEFPKDPRRDSVLLASSVFELAQQNYRASAEAAMQVEAKSERYGQAMQIVEIVTNQLESSGTQDSAKVSEQIFAELESSLLTKELTPQPVISDWGIAAAVVWAENELQREQPRRLLVAGLLDLYLGRDLEEIQGTDWKDRAILLTIVSVAGLPQLHQRVPALIEELTQLPPAAIAQTIADLNQLVPSLSQDERRKVGEWQLQLIASRPSSQNPLEGAARRQWMIQHAWAELNAGNAVRGVAIFQELLKSNPMDASLHSAYASYLTEAGGDFEKAAIDQWRLVVQRSQPQTDRWFEAKYHVIDLTDRQGDRDRARKLLKYLKTVPPGWTESAISNRFDALEKRLDAKR